MSFVPGNRSRVLFAATHLSGFLTEAGEDYSANVEDTTVFTDTAKTYLPTTDDGSVSLDGLFDGTVGAIHDALKGLKGQHDPVPYSYAPEGFATGKPAELANILKMSYNITAAVAGIVQLTSSGQATGGVDSGVALADLQTRTTSDDSAGHDSGGASSDGAVAHLHVTGSDGTGETLDVKVQHSSDGTTWVDLLTFTQQSGAGSDRQTVAGTVNQHVRAAWTLGGTDPSFDFAVTFARR